MSANAVQVIEALPEAGEAWWRARARAGLTQSALAARVGVDARTILNLENPKPGRRHVSVWVRRVIALELQAAHGGNPFEEEGES